MGHKVRERSPASHFMKFRAMKNFERSGSKLYLGTIGLRISPPASPQSAVVASNFKEGCKIRKLKIGVVLSIFYEYAACLQPRSKPSRSNAELKKREGGALDCAPVRKRTNFEQVSEELCSDNALSNNDQVRKQVKQNLLPRAAHCHNMQN